MASRSLRTAPTQSSEGESPAEDEVEPGHVQFQEEGARAQWRLERALRENRDLEQHVEQLKSQLTLVGA